MALTLCGARRRRRLPELQSKLGLQLNCCTRPPTPPRRRRREHRRAAPQLAEGRDVGQHERAADLRRLDTARPNGSKATATRTPVAAPPPRHLGVVDPAGARMFCTAATGVRARERSGRPTSVDMRPPPGRAPAPLARIPQSSGGEDEVAERGGGRTRRGGGRSTPPPGPRPCQDLPGASANARDGVTRRRRWRSRAGPAPCARSDRWDRPLAPARHQVATQACAAAHHAG